MGNNLKFNSSVCTTREQSQRLLELGLKPETADMVYTNASLPFNKDEFHIICKEYSQLNREVNYEISPFIFIPAWSLHRLLEMICNKGCEEHYYFDFSMDYDSMADVYDSIIEGIERHIKNNFINKEYLEQ